MTYIIADPDIQSGIELKKLLDGSAVLDFQGIYTTLAAAEEDILDHPPDVAFICSEKAALNAFRLAGKIKERNSVSKIVFIGACKENAVDAFEQEADGFLLLPPTKAAVSRLLRNLGIEKKDMPLQKMSRNKTGG